MRKLIKNELLAKSFFYIIGILLISCNGVNPPGADTDSTPKIKETPVVTDEGIQLYHLSMDASVFLQKFSAPGMQSKCLVFRYYIDEPEIKLKGWIYNNGHRQPDPGDSIVLNSKYESNLILNDIYFSALNLSRPDIQFLLSKITGDGHDQEIVFSPVTKSFVASHSNIFHTPPDLNDGFVWQVYVDSKKKIEDYIKNNKAFPENTLAASSVSFNPSPPKELTAQ